MNRRHFLGNAIGAAAGLAGAVSNAASPRKRSKRSIRKRTRPNFLFILMDDMGWGDLGCYGHPVLQTPHLDRLASQGCRFTNFYVPMPLCSPTRAGCLTGRDPNRYGFKHVINTGIVNPHVTVPEVHHLPIEEPTYVRQLEEVGYRTATIGKWHLSLNWVSSEPQPSQYGFDYSFIHAGGGSLYRGPAMWSRNGQNVETPKAAWFPELYVNEAVAFLKSCDDTPFCLHVWPFTPHVSEEASESFRGRYSDRTEQEKTYYGCITQMDDQLGRLFQFLDDTGLSKNTVVIFASDNGHEPALNLPQHPEARRGSSGGLRGSKHVLYEGGIRVPGIVRWPGISVPGSTSSVPVSVLDLMPTLCAAAETAPPKGWDYDGGDFRPALQGQPVERAHPLYWQCEYAMRTFVGPHYSSLPLALRHGPWKLMCDLDFGSPRLVNLDWDRAEQFPVEMEHPEVTERLREEMQRVYAAVNAPRPNDMSHVNPELLVRSSNAGQSK